MRSGAEHQATRVKFITDGYARSTNGGDPAGWNDFKIIVEREMNAIIALFGGVAIPAHGEVGGSSFSERLGVRYKLPISMPDAVTITATGSFLNKTAADVGRVTASAIATWKRCLDDLCDHDVQLQGITTYQRGVGSGTTSSVSYDFPLPKTWTGTFSVSQGFTRGSRDTALEFDLSRDF